MAIYPKRNYDLNLVESFNHTINFWINELEQYDATQLFTKPSENSWSIGQVYMHLVENTQWFLEQVRMCATTNDNENEDASPTAREMFHNNCFPDAVLEGPPENAATKQPDSKEQLLKDLVNLKDEIRATGMLISTTVFKGKTKHPGLRYFNATEWFQFAEMHFHHHLRQKNRIDKFLELNTGFPQV